MSRSQFSKSGIFFLILSLVILSGCGNGDHTRSEKRWSKADEIVRQIQLPEIPERVFSMSANGAKGDGITDNKAAFDRVIDLCREAGGGTIIVESGNWLVNGPIHLKSNMNLHLEEGARLFFGGDPAFYLPMVLTSWEGTRCYNYSRGRVKSTGRVRIPGISGKSCRTRARN